jgi:hypothetical protein
MDKLQIIGRHGESVSFSKDVNRINFCKTMKIRPFGFAEKKRMIMVTMPTTIPSRSAVIR